MKKISENLVLKLITYLRGLWVWISNWRNRKMLREARTEEYIRKLFDPEPVALIDDIRCAWELVWFRIFGRLTSNNLANNIHRAKEKNKILEYLSEASNTSASVGIDKGFVNYHILCINFSFIRSSLAPFFWSLVILIVALIITKPLGVFLGLSNLLPLPEENTVGLYYEDPLLDEYLLRVDNSVSTTYQYNLVFQPPQEINTNSLDLDGRIVPLAYGQKNHFLLEYSKQQEIFRAEVRSGQFLWVIPDQTIINAIIRFQIKDSSMVTCAELVLDPSDGINYKELACPVQNDGTYYVVVELAEDLIIGQQPQYGFIAYAFSEENETNDTQTEAQSLLAGNYVHGTTSTTDPDWYLIKVDNDRDINIQLYPEITDSVSLMLYEPSDSGYALVAFSNKSVNPHSPNRLHTLTSARGRALFISLFMESFGINLSPDWLVKNDLSVMMSIELFILMLCSIFVYGFYWLEWLITPRKYNRSLAVVALFDILEQLNDDEVLRSLDKRLRLMKTIRWLALDVPSLYKTERRVTRNTTSKTKTFFEKMSAQILHTNEIISVPSESTLEHLRKQFLRWLDIFMKGEFGDFEFTYETRQITRYQKILRVVSRNWWKWMILGFGLMLALTWLNSIDPQIANFVFDKSLLIARYILLVGLVFNIYLQWGAKESISPGFHWNDAVRFILFFVLPFIVLDTLLGTNILESLTKLLEGLKPLW